MNLQPGDVDPKNGLTVGSPEWRDAQQVELDVLLDDPSTWQFDITSNQKQVIASAYKKFQDDFGDTKYPDLQNLRLMVINVLPENDAGEVVADVVTADDTSPSAVVQRTAGLHFWEDFNDDMPEVMKKQGSMHVELNIAWGDYKLRRVLEELDFPYMDWDTQELVYSIKSPSHLRRAANAMEKFQSQDYALYHSEVKDDIVELYFRRGKVVKHDSEPEE